MPPGSQSLNVPPDGKVVPNLFVVGAMKCGTTSLHDLLQNSGAVQMCLIKEPNHFCKDLYEYEGFAETVKTVNFSGIEWVRERDEYLSLFKGFKKPLIGEASTTYLYSEVAAKGIAAFNPAAKIIILLRNPIERAYSEYQMNCAMGVTEKSFGEVIREEAQHLNGPLPSILERHIAAGMYFSQVKRYLDAFPREQVYIGVIDRPGEEFPQIIAELGEFLNIDLKPDLTKKLNAARAPLLPGLNSLLYRSGVKAFISRHIPTGLKSYGKKLYYRDDVEKYISADDRAFLSEVFAPDIKNLSSLLQIDLGHWH